MDFITIRTEQVTSEISTSTFFFSTYKNKTYNVSLKSPKITLNRISCSSEIQY